MNHKVGTNIDAWCTKCKLVLAHTIEAIAQDSIKRVSCNTCHGTHQYKSQAPGEKPVFSPRISKSKKPAVKAKPNDFNCFGVVLSHIR
jgi:cytochrome c5